ncbi:MAG: metal ABC transporter substrate-binding protein [Bacillota bacterium]|nr:metal ABC transporter substrate-binding protein [Bacillota bacterium]
MRRIIISSFLVMIIFIMSACNNSVPKKNEKKIIDFNSQNANLLNIMTTNKFLCDMVNDITEGKQNTEYMFKNDGDMDSFTYTDDSINNISRKDLFIYFGAGLEPWSDDFVNSLKKNKVSIINVSRGIRLLTFTKTDITLKENYNPYYWLSTENYKIALFNVKNAVEEKDSINRDYYEQNFAQATKKIDDCEKQIKPIYEKYKNYNFVVDGDNLDYFTKNEDLKTIKYYSYDIIYALNQKDEFDKLDKKLKNVDNLVFLYDSEDSLKANQLIINKYNMKTAKITNGSGNMDYLTILKSNADSINKSINKTN